MEVIQIQGAKQKHGHTHPLQLAKLLICMKKFTLSTCVGRLYLLLLSLK